MIHHRVLRAGWPAVSAMLAILAVFLCGVTPAALWAETRPILPGYATFVDLEARLRRLGESSWAELCSLGKTAQGRDIWLLTIAADPAQAHPAVLVLGNVHAPHLLGRELALRMAERLVNTAGEDEAVGRFLSAHTVYLIACPSPDATEKNATVPAREMAGNSLPTDDDRDFRSGEDPPADLNADGWITMMRVADPLGTHRPHPADSRVLIPVDARKNEAGAYRLYVEARDTDGDKLFGEDPGDGVDFNRNFTCNYPYFGRGAGPHQVSEPETRAVADFAFDHPNIAVVFCFSPEDNLFHPWKANPQLESQRIKTTLLSADAPYADYLAERFRELHGGQDAPAPPPSEGSFSQWAYFHYGRWSLAARPWWIPPAPSPPPKPEGSSPADTAPQGKSAEAEQPPPDAENSSAAVPAPTPQPAAENSAEPSTGPPSGPGDKPLGKDDKRGAEDLAALAWFAAQGIDGFVDWQPFEHPDFPQIIVEIGGFKPFHRLNPPAELIDPLVRPHVDFLVQLSDLWPRLELRQVEVHRLTAGLYEVTCRVVNAGYLPTMPEMGSTNRQGYPIQMTWDLPERTRWLEGNRRTSVSRLEGRGGNRDLRWAFQLPDPPTEPLRASLRAAAPTLHPVTVDVELAP